MGNEEANSGADSTDRPRILVVEDDFLLGCMIEEALRNAGFAVVGIAIDSQQALALASSDCPDLAVMDIHLANGDDGVDTAIALAGTCGIRSLFVTAHTDDATRSRAEPARPLGWLVKPFRLAALTSAVTDALSAVADERNGAEGAQ
jgi:two-component system, response regulator PdtaR